MTECTVGNYSISDSDDVISAITGTPAFSKENNLQNIGLKAVYALIGSLGIFGNGLVCLIFLTQKRSFRSITNLLILNQSMIDLLTAVIFLIRRLPPTIEILPDTPLGELICRVWVSEYLMWSLFISSTMNLVLISLERYFATCFPVKHRFHFTAIKAKLGMVFSWIYGFIYQLYWLVIRDFKTGNCGIGWSSSTLQKIMGVVFFIAEYLLPLTIMTFAYVSIILMLRRRGSPGRGVVPNIFQRAKRNIIFTLCLVFFFYVVCWTPTEITYMLYNLGYPYDFNSDTHMVVTVIVMLNMCLNPIIYTFKYQQFQRQLRHFIFGRFRENRVGIAVIDNVKKPVNDAKPLSENVP